MNAYKKFALEGLTVAQLRARRTDLVVHAPQMDGFLPGALVEQHRRCGKEGCRCSRGEPHGPYVYLQVTGRSVYVPSGLAEQVRARVQGSVELRGVLEQISAVNLELLARRQLG
jgi:hypothetical protein